MLAWTAPDFRTVHAMQVVVISIFGENGQRHQQIDNQPGT